MMLVPTSFNVSVVDCVPSPKVIGVEPTNSSLPLPATAEFRLNTRLALAMFEGAAACSDKLPPVVLSVAEVWPTSTVAAFPLAPLMLKVLPEPLALMKPVPARVAPAPTLTEPVPVAEPLVLVMSSVGVSEPVPTVVPPV